MFLLDGKPAPPCSRCGGERGEFKSSSSHACKSCGRAGRAFDPAEDLKRIESRHYLTPKGCDACRELKAYLALRGVENVSQLLGVPMFDEDLPPEP